MGLFMVEGFSQKDADNLERVKDAMAELATGKGLLGTPDATAATAFAQLLDAETRREELVMKAPGQEKAAPAPVVSAPSWQETVGAGARSLTWLWKFASSEQ